MSKKGLFTSLVIGVIATLSLGLYTLVSVFGGGEGNPQGPLNTTFNVAFRTADEIDVLSDYDKQNISFSLEDGVETH